MSEGTEHRYRRGAARPVRATGRGKALLPALTNDQVAELVETYLGERRELWQKRNKIHKWAWNALRRRKYLRFELMLDQLQDKQIPLDEVLRTPAVLWNLAPIDSRPLTV